LQIVQTDNKGEFDEVRRVEVEILRSQLQKPETEERRLRHKKCGQLEDNEGDDCLHEYVSFLAQR
jgi:hypothetical protein